MRRRCQSCLCRTCLKTCCNRNNCKGKREKCNQYKGFKQLNFFDKKEPQRKKAPRYPWEYYDIDEKRYKELTSMMRSKLYDDAVQSAAYEADKEIMKYLIKSVLEKKSYDTLEFDTELGRICVGRSDFYGIRRLFYHLFDLEVKKEHG